MATSVNLTKFIFYRPSYGYKGDTKAPKYDTIPHIILFGFRCMWVVSFKRANIQTIFGIYNFLRLEIKKLNFPRNLYRQSNDKTIYFCYWSLKYDPLICCYSIY